ncbi:hypothetical protein WN48_01469 [Eufriesea mexicana]|nr:hypothetical protein WN48_01469 [Eufriesea mexicana]
MSNVSMVAGVLVVAVVLEGTKEEKEGNAFCPEHASGLIGEAFLAGPAIDGGTIPVQGWTNPMDSSSRAKGDRQIPGEIWSVDGKAFARAADASENLFAEHDCGFAIILHPLVAAQQVRDVSPGLGKIEVLNSRWTRVSSEYVSIQIVLGIGVLTFPRSPGLLRNERCGRASSVRGPDSPLSSDLALDKPRPIPSPRQIHPLYGEKAGLLGYCDPLGNAENFPPAPNIVVEGGRIEFVRPSQDGTTTPRRNTMSRGSQTFNDESEKSDPAKRLQKQPLPSVRDQSRASTEIRLAIIGVDKVEQYHERHPNVAPDEEPRSLGR